MKYLSDMKGLLEKYMKADCKFNDISRSKTKTAKRAMKNAVKQKAKNKINKETI